MKTLLLLIKEPESSRSLLGYAMCFARDLQTNIHLLYVENPANYPLGGPDMTGAAVAQMQQSIENKLKEGKQWLSDQIAALKPTLSEEVAVEISASVGNEHRIIQEMIEEGEAQMVMVEGSGNSGVWLRDTMAKEAVRDLSCPVWIIPQNSEYHPFHEIIYATDYHEEDIPTIKKLIDLTKLLAPQITALHITDNADFELKIKNTGFQKMLAARAGYSKIEAIALVENEGEEMVDLLNRYAARKGADLLVVLKENRRFLERIFRPSSSEKIIEESSLPVLVFHAS